jgi:hypothetical protein
MKHCRECGHEVSEQALTCPSCAAPYPAKEKWDGWGFEYKSEAALFGWPWLHISFKYQPNRMPVPARGIIAIGQFGLGVVTISQFGVGLISVSQFTLSGFALAQFGIAYVLIAQFGLFVEKGWGQFVRRFSDVWPVF